jgi:hypothetical protein
VFIALLVGFAVRCVVEIVVDVFVSMLISPASEIL